MQLKQCCNIDLQTKALLMTTIISNNDALLMRSTITNTTQ